jgi:hypothetical protein
MFGMMETLLSFIFRQIGTRSDRPSVLGGLHSKIGAIPYIPNFTVPIFGDGSLGDVTISGTVTLDPGSIYQYKNLTIPQGQVLIPHKAIVMVKETLTVSGLVSASGKGAGGGRNGAYNFDRNAGDGDNGNGFAGAGGGGGKYSSYTPGNGGSTTYKDGGLGGTAPGNGEGFLYAAGIWHLPDYIFNASGGGGGGGTAGSGDGGRGGAGGGAIVIVAKNILINSTGAIRAEGLDGGAGNNGSPGGGGGGGGLIYLLSTTLEQNGAISVSGGVGAPGTPAGGNGGNGCLIKVVV